MTIASTRFREVREQPTVIGKVHESCFRSWGIVNLVREMIEADWNRDAILALIDDFRNAPPIELPSKVPPPMTPTDAKNRPETARETIDALRAAGGDGWDSIDDPEAFLGRKDDADEQIADLTQRLAEAEKDRLPHMCRDEHDEIRYRNGESEQCPLCVWVGIAAELTSRVEKAEKDRGELIAGLRWYADKANYKQPPEHSSWRATKIARDGGFRAAALLSRLDNGGAA